MNRANGVGSVDGLGEKRISTIPKVFMYRFVGR
jgi:hypothetical protein